MALSTCLALAGPRESALCKLEAEELQLAHGLQEETGLWWNPALLLTNYDLSDSYLLCALLQL